MSFNKQQLIDRLNNDDSFKIALERLDEDKREEVKQLAERLVATFADALAPIVTRVEGDSNFAEELRKTLVTS